MFLSAINRSEALARRRLSDVTFLKVYSAISALAAIDIGNAATNSKTFRVLPARALIHTSLEPERFGDIDEVTKMSSNALLRCDPQHAGSL